jgi:hypothetical protein
MDVEFEFLTITMDGDGFYQPSPMAPDWPHVGTLLAGGWRVLAVTDTKCEEVTVRLWRAKKRTDYSPESNSKNQ